MLTLAIYFSNSIMDIQLNAAIKSKINYVIDILSKDLYPTITVTAQNFDIPT